MPVEILFLPLERVCWPKSIERELTGPDIDLPHIDPGPSDILRFAYRLSVMPNSSLGAGPSAMPNILNALMETDLDGARILALLRPPTSPPGVYSLGRIPLVLGAVPAGRPLTYGRATLFQCANSPWTRVMPPGLAEKLQAYPELKRQSHRGGPSGESLTLDELEASMLAPGPKVTAKPKAHICTWDPKVRDWILQVQPAALMS